MDKIIKNFLFSSVSNHIMMGMIGLFGIQSLIMCITNMNDYICRVDSFSELCGNIVRFIMIFVIEQLSTTSLGKIYIGSSIGIFISIIMCILSIKFKGTAGDLLMFSSWLINRIFSSTINAFRDNNIYKLMYINKEYNIPFLKTIKNTGSIICYMYIKFITFSHIYEFIPYMIVGASNIYASKKNFDNSKFLYSEQIEGRLGLPNNKKQQKTDLSSYSVKIIFNSLIKSVRSLSHFSLFKITVYSLIISFCMPSPSCIFNVYHPQRVILFKAIGQSLIIPIISLLFNYRILMLIFPLMCSACYGFIAYEDQIQNLVLQKSVFIVWGCCISIKTMMFLLITRRNASYGQLYQAYSTAIDGLGTMISSIFYEKLKINIGVRSSFGILLTSTILLCSILYILDFAVFRNNTRDNDKPS